jgi:hypothetical protein
MLIIRRQQLEVLAQAALKNLEGDLFRRERLRAPHTVARPGDDEALRACIRLAFAKADEGGFTDRTGAAAYAQAALDCGLGFATDPMHRWAAQALQWKGEAKERGRLLMRAMAYAAPMLTVVEWRRADSAVELLARALECAAAEGVPDDLPVVVLRHLAIDIRRVMGLDNQGEHWLFGLAEAMAQRHGLSGPLGTALFLLAVVLFGHDCAADPRYAWTGSVELSSTDRLPELRMKTMLDVCRLHIAEHLAGAVSQQQTDALPMRVLPTGQRFISIGLASALPPDDESQALRPGV